MRCPVCNSHDSRVIESRARWTTDARSDDAGAAVPARIDRDRSRHEQVLNLENPVGAAAEPAPASTPSAAPRWAPRTSP